MKTFYMVVCLVLLLSVSTTTIFAQKFKEIPEIVFKNPVLISGVSNQDGAIYRFNDIAPGYDATVKIVGRSSSEVVLDTIDVAGVGNLGYDKALQPKLGIPGIVGADLSWWMKFKLCFLRAGTDEPATLNKFTATAIDLDGDGYSVQENLLMYKATSVQFSSPTLITSPSLLPMQCEIDNLYSSSTPCYVCNGNGYNFDGGGFKMLCKTCTGAGYLFSRCSHPWTGEDIFVQAPVTNQPGIDTAATQNMASFTYQNVSSFYFQYGAKSTLGGSTAGERLNSIWFKGFNLEVPKILPVKLSGFTAQVDKNQVVLKWSTASEKDFSHFDVQRSLNGKEFQDIALVFSRDNFPYQESYTYKDKLNFLSGTIYYRLKMVDVSKEFSYSEILAVTQATANNLNSLNIYPNPIKDCIHLALPAEWKGKDVKVDIYGLSGKTIKTILFKNTSTQETINFAGETSKGVYILKSTCNNNQAESRFIVN
ncbi:MAG: hypothetical protein NVS1B13_15880 [Flavisolibacter sp.]